MEVTEEKKRPFVGRTSRGSASTDFQARIKQRLQKEKNKLARATTGNRQNTGIKLAHWNAGSAHLANKMNEIEQVVSSNTPHIVGISEAKSRGLMILRMSSWKSMILYSAKLLTMMI